MGCLEIFGGNQCLSIEAQDIGIIGILVQALITELVGQQGLLSLVLLRAQSIA